MSELLELVEAEHGGFGSARAFGARLWIAGVLALPGARECITRALEASRPDGAPFSARAWLAYAGEQLPGSHVAAALGVLSESPSLLSVPN